VTLTKHTVLFSIVTCPQITSCYSPEPNIPPFRGLCAVFEKKKRQEKRLKNVGNPFKCHPAHSSKVSLMPNKPQYIHASALV